MWYLQAVGDPGWGPEPEFSLEFSSFIVIYLFVTYKGIWDNWQHLNKTCRLDNIKYYFSSFDYVTQAT